MGMYLNPGADMLRQGRRSRIYVDKSAMISFLNSVVGTEQKYVCVSRPRRFGKSMAANMVCAYYDRTVDGAAEFAGLQIAADPSFDAERNRYDVVRINMQEFLSATHEVGALLNLLQRTVVRELTRAYAELDPVADAGLPFCMSDVYGQTGRQFVVVIDEWDCVMREMQADHEAQKRYLDFLRLWLKDRAYVALCYMTGILPIKKYGSHSALNMFSEFSMVDARQMAPYVGFTDGEVRALCDVWGRDYIDCRAWYDGYRLRQTDTVSVEAYSPKSVVEAMTSGVFSSYWNQTETFEALRRYIDLNMDGLHDHVVRLVSGDRVPVNTGTYVNDMTTLNSADDVLTLLIHLGYLTYDAESEETFVPNREVMGEFANAVRAGGWDEVSRSIEGSDGLLDSLIALDHEAVAAGVERAHEDAASIIAYNEENSLACTLRLAFFSAIRRWRIVREAPAGKGFADMTLVPLAARPDAPGIVIELKWGSAPEDAIEQIRERGYDRALDGLAAAGRVLLCGIAYDPKTKRHSCAIERA